jgi:Putative Zn-dependent protease, contains TPR repeats
MFETPLARARELKTAGHYAEAVKLLMCALEEFPADPKLKASLADAYYRLTHFREALALAGEILRDNPNDPQALIIIGNVLLARKKPREALAQFTLALAAAEQDYLWARCARCHLDLKDLPAALAAIRRGQALAPDNHELLRLQHEVAKKLGDRDLAQAAETRLASRSQRKNQ